MLPDVIASSPNVLLLILSRLLIIPDEYTSISASSECRIFQTALHQANCGACAAFALATVVSMHACLYDNEDFIPSPYRLFDCANGTCEDGVSYGRVLSVLRFGVEDINQSTPKYGRPCAAQYHPATIRHHAPLITHMIDDPLQIKSALMLFGPLLGTMTHLIYRDPLSRAYRLLGNKTRDIKHHAIVVVGWDAEGNWIVQNSWGQQWGDEFGRGRIAQDVLDFAFDPTVRRAIQGCYGCLVLCITFILVTTPKKHMRIYLAIYIGLFYFGLLPMLLMSWEKGLL